MLFTDDLSTYLKHYRKISTAFLNNNLSGESCKFLMEINPYLTKTKIKVIFKIIQIKSDFLWL